MPELQNAFAKEPREHNEKHLHFIRGLPCCICQDNTATEAAHVKLSVPGVKRNVGIGEKAHDRWTVPLCGRHHRIQHQIGEREFWLLAGINPIQLASDLWSCSGDQEQGEQIALSAHAQVL